MGQFAGLRPKSINVNEINQSKKEIALSACLVTKIRVAKDAGLPVTLWTAQ